LSQSVPGGSVLVASARETNCAGGIDFNNVGTITAAIGDDVTVQAQLLATAFGRAGGEGSVDAALRMFLVPIGDFSYTTLSGNSYLQTTTPAPVPEPATLSLLGLGLAGAAARRFRRRK
jgi:PEP-CTERM putative exosortase interaction domain